MNQEEFLIQHLTEGKSYQYIADHFGITRKQLSEWWESGYELRFLIKKANQLFASKKNMVEFVEFTTLGQRAFFEWYRNQPRSCAYCGIEECKLEQLFDYEKGTLQTKRGRGRTLELERRNTKTNEYSMKNCVLACYLCNNHKSDLITEDEHLEYFAPIIRKYLEDKYNELNDNR